MNIPFHSFSGHLGEVLDVITTKDSKYVIFAINDGTIRTINLENKKLIQVIHLTNSFPIAIDLSFDDRFLAAADDLGYISIWEYETGKKISMVKAYEEEIYDISFSSKDYYIISSGVADGSFLKKWKIDKKGTVKLEKSLEVEDEITKLCITPKNNSVVALGEDIIYISNFNLDKGLQQIKHEGLATINISTDGKFVYGGDISGKVSIWNIKNGKLLDELFDTTDKTKFSKPIFTIGNSPDGKFLIYGDRLKLKLWDIKNKTILNEFRASGTKDDKDKFNTALFTPDNTSFVIGCRQRLRIGSVATGKWVKSIARPLKFEDYNKVEISPDLRFVICTRQKLTKDKISEIIEIWNVKDNKQLHEIEPPIHENSSISCLAIAPNGKYFVTGDDTDSADARAIIWDIKTGKPKKILQGLDYGVNALIISNDSKYIITSDKTFDVEIWNAKTGKLDRKLSESTKNISYFALTEDYKFLVCAFRDVLDRDHDIIVWDLESNKIINLMSAEIDWDDRIVWIGFSTDQKFLYARSEQGFLINWEFESGKLKSKIEDQDNYVLYNPFSEINVFPLAENIIISVSPDSKNLPKDFIEFLRGKIKKSDWISHGMDHYFVKESCPDEQIQEYENQLKSII